MLQYRVSTLPPDDSGGALRKHVVWCGRHPDPESIFDLASRDIQHLGDQEFFSALLARGYDGIILTDEDTDTLIGHIFYQEVEGSLRVFSLYVAQECRGRGIAAELVTAFLEQVCWQPQIREVWLGAGNNVAVKRLWERASKNKLPLCYKLRKGSAAGQLYIVR